MLINMLITIFIMSVAQIAVGALWYSNILFGKIFVSLTKTDLSNLTKSEVNKAYLRSIISAVIKSIIIYFLSYDMFILQSVYVFKMIILTVSLVLMVMLDDFIWVEKSFKLYLLQASQIFVSLISAFLVAFLTYSMVI